MTDKEFYAQILAKILLDSGEGVVSLGDGTTTMLHKMTESAACRALKQIHDILDDDSLDDRTCFQRIERVVCVLEDLGPGAGKRHDFG